MDRIEIRGLRVFGRHGVFPRERREGQHFVIDLTLDCDLSAAAASDALAETIDYGTLAERVAVAVTDTRFDLIEALAGHIADLALAEDGVAAVTVRVAKPEVSLTPQVTDVAVVLRREKPIAP